MELGKFASDKNLSYISASRTQPRLLFSNTHVCFSSVSALCNHELNCVLNEQSNLSVRSTNLLLFIDLAFSIGFLLGGKLSRVLGRNLKNKT